MEKNYSNNNVTFNSMASDIVVGLDIGTTKVATIVGYLNNRGKIEIIIKIGFIQIIQLNF